MKVKVYKRFYDPVEANIIREKLISHEIYCFLTNENTSATFGHQNIVTGGINLLVHEEDIEEVDKILSAAPDNIGEEEKYYEKRICPRCNSENIEERTSGSIFFNLLAALTFGRIILGSRQIFHCRECGNNFRY
jgi:hypothetical protein